MIIELGIDYPISNTPLKVKITAPGHVEILDLSQKINYLNLDIKLLVCNQFVPVHFECNDLNIINHPLTITKIVLDNFYQSPQILHSGSQNFDSQFLSLAAQNNQYIDPTVNDSNRLDFTGTLVYQFKWPFYKNVFQ